MRKKAVINIQVQVFLYTVLSFIFGKYLRVEWLGHIKLSEFLRKLVHNFTKRLCHFTVPPIVYEIAVAFWEVAGLFVYVCMSVCVYVCVYMYIYMHVC